MDFYTMMGMYFNFILYQRVSSSRELFTQIGSLSKENVDNILEKFFVDLDKAHLKKHEPRHITVVGGSTKDLQEAQPFFENHPYIVCEHTKRCGYSELFNRGSLVIIFLEDLSEPAFRKNIEVLSQSSKSKVLFVFKGVMIKTNDVLLIFTLALQYNVQYCELAHLGRNVIKLYTDFLATNCTTEVRLVNVWRPGSGSDNINVWGSRLRDMNGCPITVTSLTFTPKMMIQENENGSLTIVGGREGNLILALAKELNFTVSLRYPALEDQLKYSRKISIVRDVASGISEIGIGRLRPTNHPEHTIKSSFSYDEECVTWGIPRVIKSSNDIVWVEFSWEVWVSISLVFGVCCIVGYAHRIIVTSKNGDRNNPGLITIFLDVVALHLGNPVLHVSSSSGGRFMLIAYLYYVMVITTAYKTSLASILATDKGTPRIVDAQGIIDANLSVGGSSYDYDILKDQVDDSKVTAKLLERFIVNNNDSITWDQLMFRQDYAFLARRSSLDYDRQKILTAHKSVTFDVLHGCVLAYPAVIVFPVRSLLRKPVDNIIQLIVESGILAHWDIDEYNADKILKQRNFERYFEERAAYKFRNIFGVYFFCISVSLIVFLIELIVSKLDPNKWQRTTNQTRNL